MDGVKRHAVYGIVYTIDPYGTRSGFPQELANLLLDSMEPYGNWQNSKFSCPIAGIQRCTKLWDLGNIHYADMA